MDIDLVITDSDGVLKYNKKPIASNLINIVTYARETLHTIVIRITGAPASHLLDGLTVDRAFAETGGVELLHDGRIVVSPHAHHAEDALYTLTQSLDITTNDGHVDTVHGAFGIEGIRHVTLTLFFGQHPLYPEHMTSADHTKVADWIQGQIDALGLPLFITSGTAETYCFLDIGHPEIMKKEIIVNMLLKEIPHRRAYYLGDSGNDAGAMGCNLIPVTFSNGTPEIQQIVRERNGILINLPGPHGGSYEFFHRFINGTI